MKTSFAAMFAIALGTLLYVYVGSTKPIEDAPLAPGATNAVQYPVAPSVNGQAANVEEPPLLGSLRSREHTIYLYAGKFSVEDASGKLLARLVDQKQFSSLLPELFSEFEQMYADGEFIADNRTHGKLPDG